MSTATLHTTRKRIRYDLAEIGLPEVTCIGIYDMARAERYGKVERHEDELEIILVRRADFAYPIGDVVYHVPAGELLIIHPGEAHGGRGHLLERCAHWWMKLRVPKRGQSFLALSRADSDALINALAHLPGRQFKAIPRLEAFLEEIVELIRARSSPLHRLAVASRIATWLTLVVESAHRTAEPRTDPEVEAAKRLILDNPSVSFDLDAFSKLMGTSSSRLRRNFRLTVGVPIHDYHLEAKVHRARDLLAEASPRTITDIAFELGFSSSQYFSTVFKRYTTLTPSEYRQRR